MKQGRAQLLLLDQDNLLLLVIRLRYSLGSALISNLTVFPVTREQDVSRMEREAKSGTGRGVQCTGLKM